jgi:transposase-like protein
MTFRMEIVISDLLKDHEKVRIACPRCRRGWQYKVGRIRHDPSLKCPSCWTPFVVQAGPDRSDVSSAG